MRIPVILLSLGLTLTLAGEALANSQYRNDWSATTGTAFDRSENDLLRRKYYRLGQKSDKKQIMEKKQKTLNGDRGTDKTRAEGYEVDQGAKVFAW